ncbi:hypothetical protein [Kitasatospora sp. NPDC050543]|uniref:hypothetical protein n=1 Tax=Kitasatospora sp. NPDC050543 TaxID=3364054 RepID=UPI0037AFEBC0
MLRHAIAPSRDFTQISNAQAWDDSLSDAAFRLLVRGMALPPSHARSTTVTELAAGLTGGRITADRARRQLARAGLLHCTRWRNATGQVRTESLLSNVPLSAAEAERYFAEHLGQQQRCGRPPGAGGRGCGEAALRASGTALPAGETSGKGETSPLPVPSSAPRPRAAPEWEVGPAGFPLPMEASAEAAEAERVLTSLRRSDPRLVLGAAEVGRLAPLAAEWLARGVSSAGVLHALTAGLPQQIKSPAALVRCRLREKTPAPVQVMPLVACEGCERAFRPVGGESRCGACRREGAAAPAGGGERRGWRERVALAGRAGLTTLTET